MTPGIDTGSRVPGAHPLALQAALSHLTTTQTALLAALGAGPSTTDRGTEAAAPAPPGLGLVAQLAERSLQPWADRRPWTLVALAVAAGALLASRRGRGLVGAVAMTALFAPTPDRLAARVLGRGIGLVLRHPAEPRR